MTKFNFNSITYRSGGANMSQLSNTELGVFLRLNEVDLARLKSYTMYWDYYEGRQWEFERDDGDPLVTKNFIEFFINKSVSWLTQNSFINKVPESMRDFVGSFLDRVWKANDKDILFGEIGLVGSVSGDAYVMVTMETPKAGEELSEKHIRLVLLDEKYTFPIFNPENKNEILAIKIETFLYEPDPEGMINPQGLQVKGSLKRFTQIITKDKIVEQYEGQPAVVKRNILGEIPVIPFKNLPNPHGYFGRSDIQSLLTMQKDLNEKSTDISDIIAYHSSPLMLMYGAKASQVEKSFRSFWTGLPAESKVEILNSNADLSNANTYIGSVKDDMFTISETPKILADSPSISNTSGVALTMQYTPIVQKTKRKKPRYEKGLSGINKLILKYAELFRLIYLPKDMCCKCRGKVVTVLDHKSEFPRLVKRCYLVDEHFALATSEKAKKILQIEDVETETIDLSTVTVDPETGLVQISENKQFEAVPTDCRVSVVADPYDIPVEILDALPRDEQLTADYWIKLKQERIVSRRFILEQLSTIPEDKIDDILRQLKQELEEEIEAEKAKLPEQTSGDKMEPGTKELERAVTKMGGHNERKKDPNVDEMGD